MKVDFISLQEQFDTATPIGQAMFSIIGAIAQLERDIIRERVTAGIERAKARGKKLGGRVSRSMLKRSFSCVSPVILSARSRAVFGVAARLFAVASARLVWSKPMRPDGSSLDGAPPGKNPETTIDPRGRTS